MRNYLAAGLSLACLLAANPAQARHIWYFGKSADAFIARYLSSASIPGAINQAFAYGRHRRGWATCHVPAMGARSDGAVSDCDVKF